MEIREGGLDHPDVVVLLRAHLGEFAQLSPPESMHALGFDALRDRDVAFWSAWEDGALLGFGALKHLDPAHAEIKSMRTARAHLRKGVAAALLQRILDEATRRGYRRLSLETGSAREFAPAHRLYERFGFATCGPFAGYVEDTHSVFMTREMPSNARALRTG
ncbi:MAG TPA: GNAT family N-acetyltransferase [Xanthomonadaceae bacterium]|jgi:putative acetyltransferase